MQLCPFDAKICLVTSFRDTCYIEILPKDKNPTRGQWVFGATAVLDPRAGMRTDSWISIENVNSINL
nr:hypothetical protein CFP56_79395 [Quercus suber]